MKTLLQKTAAIFTLTATLLATNIDANAQNLTYLKASNPTIGITVENATGATYTVKDKKGNTVMQGKVKSNKTFQIPTSKLIAGDYHFYIGNMIVQQFTIA